jgi:pantoate--beta-alanine ligase
MQRLITIVQPQHLLMGQKDYQQCMVVKRLIEIMNQSTTFDACPTRRETDGLAMSSRNMRLNDTERKNATAIYQALSYLKKNLHPGDLTNIIDHAKNILLQNNFKIDYVETADANTLQLTHSYNSRQQIVALIAAFQNEVRLIDNMVLTDEQN